MKFYLGLNIPSQANDIRIPVFVSVNRLIKSKTVLDHDDWVMDSGGFTMISKHGEYTISEKQYLQCIEFQNPIMAFCQDWMCEEHILKKTGLTIKEHQKRTTISFLNLHSKNSSIMPVLQGWTEDDYCRHIDHYVKMGVGFDYLYGLGTVCSRNGSPKIIKKIVYGITSRFPKIRLHGFGVKADSLVLSYRRLESADSMAWSFAGRREKLCTGCDAKSCSACLEFGLVWRRKLLRKIRAAS
jgi:hypothetical protein